MREEVRGERIEGRGSRGEDRGERIEGRGSREEHGAQFLTLPSSLEPRTSNLKPQASKPS
jgi:hypothetical protein